MGDRPTDELTWRDGDIYFWHWKQAEKHMPYHCCSCKAIVQGGILRDTFWSSGSDGKRWSKEEAVERLHLEYVGNLDEIEKIDEWLAEYYDPKDIVNLNHSNSSRHNCYRRKGSTRSREVMLERVRHLQQKAKSDIQSATQTLKRLCEAECDIVNGATLEAIYL